MITAVTPTGDRPLAFALCQNWMRRQTRPPDQWIVVDDGKTPLTPRVSVDYIRREPQPGDPQHTLAINLREALPHIKGNGVLVVEDDEYYGPAYVEEMSKRLDEYRVVGICRSKYYHLPSGGYVQMGNMGHASLAETGFRSDYLPDLAQFIARGMQTDWLDTQIWRAVRPPGRTFPPRGRMTSPRLFMQMKRQVEARPVHIKSLLFVDSERPLYLGMKGLSGRGGIGQGHKTQMYRTHDSEDRAILKRWVPEDYQVYLDILSGRLTEENYSEYFGWT